MIRLNTMNEAFEDFKNGNIYILFSQRALKISELESDTGRKFVNWNQCAKFALQRLRAREYVQIINVKTLEMLWLDYNKIDEYTADMGILDMSAKPTVTVQ